jgi:hypothetical protein
MTTQEEFATGAGGYPATFRDWCRLVCKRSVIKRGLKYAVVVGAILIAINHGDAILRGELTPDRYLKMGLTVMVPYLVSVFSSVGAMMEGIRSKTP